MKRIYIAGPITHGDQGDNVRRAIQAGHALIRAGHAPFIPHLFVFAHMHEPQAYETWMLIDFTFLSACDALLRLEGYSPGADRELAYAEALGLPVFTDLDALLARFREAA